VPMIDGRAGTGTPAGELDEGKGYRCTWWSNTYSAIAVAFGEHRTLAAVGCAERRVVDLSRSMPFVSFAKTHGLSTSFLVTTL